MASWPGADQLAPRARSEGLPGGKMSGSLQRWVDPSWVGPGPGRWRGLMTVGAILVYLLVAASPSCLAYKSDGGLFASDPPAGYFDEPQPLVYMMSYEPGSGDGRHLSSSSSSSSDSSSSFQFPTDEGASDAPSLIQAKCWNNYQQDDDCKRINVIGASPEEQSLTDDSLITPVVIFESSSNLPAEGQEEGPGSSLAPPYFVPPTQRTPSPSANDQFAAPPAGATRLPPTEPTTQVFQATPRSSKQPPRTSTASRTCRDENDEDCDEPEGPESATHPGHEGPAASTEDQSDEDEDADESNGQDSSIEPDNSVPPELGSGNGSPDDEPENPDEEFEPTEGSGGSYVPDQVATTRIVTEPPPSTATQAGPSDLSTPTSGANIEVIVHSTLPSSFPSTSQRSVGYTGRSNASTTTTPTTTSTTTTPASLLPDDTFTSKPVFPSSAAPYDDTDEPVEGGEPQGGSEPFNQEPTTTENLYTFVPIPLSGSRDRLIPTAATGKSQPGGQVADVNTFVPVLNQTSQQQAKLAPRVDGAWRRPAQGGDSWSSRPPRPLVQEPPVVATPQEPSNPVGPAKRIQTSTEVLPQLLVYASIVIIVVTCVIFTIVALTFWRRNAARQRALLMHKHQLNGSGGPMAASMSHGSHLVVNMQQPGLLSTYAPGKGLAMGKVTASLVRPPHEDRITEEEGEEHENLVKESPVSSSGQERSQSSSGEPLAPMAGSSRQAAAQDNNRSWSNSDDQTTSHTGTTTTNSSSGSQRTSDSRQQVALVPQPSATHYPTSMSDERQNSGSVSESPIDTAPLPLAPSMIVEARRQQQLQFQRQQLEGRTPGPYGQLPPERMPVGYPGVQRHPYAMDPYYANQQQPVMNGSQAGMPVDERYVREPIMMAPQQPAVERNFAGFDEQVKPMVRSVMNQYPADPLMQPVSKGPMRLGPMQRPYPPPSPALSYASSTLPRHLMQQPAPVNGDFYPPYDGQGNMRQHNGHMGQTSSRLANGSIRRSTISMEFSNEFDAHV